MLEQIKLDACYLFEVERSDRDGVKYALVMYLLMIVLLTLIFGRLSLSGYDREQRKSPLAPLPTS